MKNEPDYGYDGNSIYRILSDAERTRLCRMFEGYYAAEAERPSVMPERCLPVAEAVADYGYIWTLNGKRIALGCDKADYGSWDVTTIAHALSRQGRWSGHTHGSFAYSVAQHSVIVSYLVDPQFALEGLFHDAAEFVLADVATPVKKLLPEDAAYRVLTRRWDAAIAERFDLRSDAVAHMAIKQADRLVQHREALILVGADSEALRRFGEENRAFGSDWGVDANADLERLPSDIYTMLQPIAPNDAKWAFLRRFSKLAEARRLQSELIGGDWELQRPPAV